MLKLFLDANILFTAANSEQGISRALFKLAAVGRCSLVTSRYAADEARRNLCLKSPTVLSAFDEMLRQLELVREPSAALIAMMQAVPLVDKDTPIMAAAVESKADILVTGDRKDIGHLFGQTVEGVLVFSPSDSFDRLLE